MTHSQNTNVYSFVIVTPDDGNQVIDTLLNYCQTRPKTATYKIFNNKKRKNLLQRTNLVCKNYIVSNGQPQLSEKDDLKSLRLFFHPIPDLSELNYYTFHFIPPLRQQISFMKQQWGDLMVYPSFLFADEKELTKIHNLLLANGEDHCEEDENVEELENQIPILKAVRVPKAQRELEKQLGLVRQDLIKKEQEITHQQQEIVALKQNLTCLEDKNKKTKQDLTVKYEQSQSDNQVLKTQLEEVKQKLTTSTHDLILKKQELNYLESRFNALSGENDLKLNQINDLKKLNSVLQEQKRDLKRSFETYEQQHKIFVDEQKAREKAEERNQVLNNENLKLRMEMAERERDIARKDAELTEREKKVIEREHTIADQAQDGKRCNRPREDVLDEEKGDEDFLIKEEEGAEQESEGEGMIDVEMTEATLGLKLKNLEVFVKDQNYTLKPRFLASRRKSHTLEYASKNRKLWYWRADCNLRESCLYYIKFYFEKKKGRLSKEEVLAKCKISFVEVSKSLHNH